MGICWEVRDKSDLKGHGGGEEGLLEVAQMQRTAAVGLTTMWPSGIGRIQLIGKECSGKIKRAT